MQEGQIHISHWTFCCVVSPCFFLRVMQFFQRVKIFYPTPQINMSVQGNFADIYLQRMRDRSMLSGTELPREIQLNDWSTAGEHSRRCLYSAEYRWMINNNICDV